MNPMESIAALVTWSGGAQESQTLQSLRDCKAVAETALVLSPGTDEPAEPHTTIQATSLWSKPTILEILRWFEVSRAEHLLWIFSDAPIFSPSGLDRLRSSARDADAAIAYGDYFEVQENGTAIYHPLLDYQLGSLRDDFDFGAAVLLRKSRLRGMAEELEKYMPNLDYGGWYDMRLRLVERGPALHLSEPIYRMAKREESPSARKVFDYLDPGRRDYQLEMEAVATDYLQRIGALLASPKETSLEEEEPYPVEASVIIPVKNRARTIADAVGSALSQQTTFDFNVIVIDNHSKDGTTDILRDCAKNDERLVHLVPARTDLLIGGCWNEAIYSEFCGRFAAQLDSDDLYDGTDVLERMVRELKRGPYALVIGSYSIVAFDLEPLPPGLVDHREWTDSNGHNNALRIAGLGAPRAFHVPTLRTVGFPNVSYGEDYAVVLRLSRTHPVGRIYESLYWCRRWEENSDFGLSLDTANRYAAYKDRLRTIEIAARQHRAKGAR
jgi:hypothetical protein